MGRRRCYYSKCSHKTDVIIKAIVSETQNGKDKCLGSKSVPACNKHAKRFLDTVLQTKATPEPVGVVNGDDKCNHTK